MLCESKLSLKFVSHSSQCYDMLSVFLEIISEIFYMSVNGSVIAEKVIAPNIGKEFVSR